MHCIIRKRRFLAAAVGVVILVLLAWVAMSQRDRFLTMQEQLAAGHEPDWVELDTEVPEIAAAVQRARASLPEFIKRVPRYDRTLETQIGVFTDGEIEKMGQENERRSAMRRDPPSGPTYAIRADVLGVRIPGVGHVMPHIWLPHARYDEREGLFWCLPPENAPSWFRTDGEIGFGVPANNVVDWRIIREGRVEGAFTTRAVKQYMEKQRH
jgi:hypothetical protein